jgi:hypothetical protein
MENITLRCKIFINFLICQLLDIWLIRNFGSTYVSYTLGPVLISYNIFHVSCMFDKRITDFAWKV